MTDAAIREHLAAALDHVRAVSTHAGTLPDEQRVAAQRLAGEVAGELARLACVLLAPREIAEPGQVASVARRTRCHGCLGTCYGSTGVDACRVCGGTGYES